MRSFITIILSVFVAILLPGIVSCTPESCLEETIAFVKAPLYSSSSEINVAPTSLTLYGLDLEDNRIYDNTKSVKKAQIPMDPEEENCSFIIGINSGTDTLTFFYTTFTHLISRECGYTFFYNIDSLITTRNSIDTVIIKNRYVTTADAENIRIYY